MRFPTSLALASWLLSHPISILKAADPSSTDDLWSRLAAACTANAFLKRNAAGDGWECSNLAGSRIDIGGTVYSTSGVASAGAMEFSSNVVITGDLTVKSTKTRALHIPAGGLIVGEDQADIAPGHIRAKELKLSTITLVGSAILFEESATGVVKATMTSTSLEINGVSAATVKNKNSGAGAPAAAECDEESEFGTQYISRTPSRLYICADNGAGGYEWRYTNISP